jgi:hypothetical protein
MKGRNMHCSDDLREAFQVCVADMMEEKGPLDDVYWNGTYDIDGITATRKALIDTIMRRLIGRKTGQECTDQMPRDLVYKVEELLESEGEVYLKRAFRYGHAAARIVHMMNKLGCYRKTA